MTSYYNEHDAYAAQWLRNLIAAGHLPAGEVDERDIRDITPEELTPFTQCHFFAGIGVWPHALRRAGWPDDRPVWTGSCPCQPFSAAGAKRGIDDERHLWPDWFHLLEERRPPVVLGEQVASKDGLAWLDLVSADLEGAGYAFGAADLCAAGFSGAHIRQRLYFVGMANDEGRGRRVGGDVALARQGGYADRRGDASRGLADPDGRLSGDGELQRGGLDRFKPEDGCAGGRGVEGPRHQEPKRMADTPVRGRQHEPDEGPADVQRQTAANTRSRPEFGGHGSGPSRLGDAQRPRLEGRRGPERDRHQEDGQVDPRGAGLGQADELGDDSPSGGARAPMLGRTAVDWLFCRDGRWRPVRPGSFPLAHSPPNRVGRLRAYGNALDAETAAEFIGAVMDTMGALPSWQTPPPEQGSLFGDAP